MIRVLRIFTLLLFCSISIPKDIHAHSDSAYVISNIRIVGNNKTKEYIIHRELSFELGDTILSKNIIAELANSRQNLQNTSLFNFVTIEHFPVVEMYTEVLITVTERWYVWPYPILEVADPNFNTWWETKDVERLNWGAMVMDRNFRGRKEKLGFLLQLGYSKKAGLFYDVPYTEKHQKIGYGLYTSYVQNYEAIYGTNNNKRLFVRPSGKTREEWYNAAYLRYRNKVRISHQLIGTYQDVMVHDSVIIKNADYFFDSTSRMRVLGLEYVFKDDHRDNKSYPLNGYFIKVNAAQRGFNMLSDVSVTLVTSELKLFSEVGAQFYWAASAKGSHVFQKRQPYFFQNSLGYEDFVRGYEYYVINGQSSLLLKTNLKYQLLSSGKKTLPVVKNPNIAKFHYAFYLNAFMDGGYISDNNFQNNDLANSWLIGYGVGLDFVTYYDKVVRVEFTTNKLNEFGFFLHFVQPI